MGNLLGKRSIAGYGLEGMHERENPLMAGFVKDVYMTRQIVSQIGQHNNLSH